jgi:exopolysaccharide/PEP-CTERM locus tyrosine autokinase
MGKFSDALEKAGSSTDKRTSSEAKVRRLTKPLDEPREEPLKSKEMIDALRLEPDVCQYLPTHELLVACRQDGNRDSDFAAEQYKMLRSQLLFPLERPTPRTIMVTSAIPGEGKSTVSSNLAISIALGKNENVLLIECDLRRPSLARLFGMRNVKGLADYLMEKDELPNLLHKTQIERLTLLVGGRRPRNPYELLSSRLMVDLLEEVKSRYDDRYIILDSPPTQVAAETGVLSKFVEGVLFVVGCGKSSKKVIQESLEKIQEDKLLGVVFNGYEGKYTSEYYYKYYGHTKKSFFDRFRRRK